MCSAWALAVVGTGGLLGQLTKTVIEGALEGRDGTTSLALQA